MTMDALAGSGRKHETSGGAGTAWQAFAANLTPVLSALTEDQYLVLSAKRRPWYVQFAAQGSFGMRAEAVGNHYLKASQKIPDDRVSAILELGWVPPTGTPGEATSSGQPDGSPNFFRDFEKPVPFSELAIMARETFTRGFGLAHPGQLEYYAFDANGRVLLLPTLGLAHRPPAPPPPKADPAPVLGGFDPGGVRQIALEVARTASGSDELTPDGDGDLPVRFGSAIVFVRVLEEPLCVRVFSPVVAKVDGEMELLRKLNEMNSTTRFARFLIEGETVFASVDVPVSPLVPDHLGNAIYGLGHLADDVDDALQQEFGGRTAFGEFRPRPAERALGFRPRPAQA